MNQELLNDRIVERGRQIFGGIAEEKPSLFDRNAWMGKVLDWAMRDAHFKQSLFRFVDVFPSLSTRKLLADHVHEYFSSDSGAPTLLGAGTRIIDMLGPVGEFLMDRALSANIRQMGRQFIIGENLTEAIRTVRKVREDGFATVVDVLGEATLSDDEAEEYLATYVELLDAMQKEKSDWPPLSTADVLDWGYAPRINLAVKPTALYCLANPQDFEGSVLAILGRMRRLLMKVMEAEGFLCIDMESHRFKDITLEVFRRLRLEYPTYPYLGVVLQSYLRETDDDLSALLEWGDHHDVPLSIRLVKGAYWDYEMARAKQTGQDVPVWTRKSETDAACERQARKILANHGRCHFACASHNIRTISAVLEMAQDLRVPADRYEFQLLYGMAEPVRKAILNVAGRVRLYCPYGSLIPGMGYLVRRLIENTANESFLRRSFAEERDLDRLLEDPVTAREREIASEAPRGNEVTSPSQSHGKLSPFRNEPLVDFTRRESRDAFPAALKTVRERSGRKVALHIGSHDVFTDDLIPDCNPARPSEILAHVCQAGTEETDRAIAVAADAFTEWRNTSSHARADCMIRAASVLRSRIFEMAAWQVLEIGKQWDQAYADVAEAIDFLEYYAREMIRLGVPQQAGNIPGEENLFLYEPRGVAAVIAPWNFPLAISTGMVAAALVTGNCVVYKPSSLTPIVGRTLADVFREAGLPPGVFNFVPGRGSITGDFLVDHPGISLVAFTGSLETGLRIIERAAKVHPGQANVKRVICEMGGKNAIIIDDDADLDEAVPQVAHSAFGFQGQKCSACSRVIVLDAVYERFVSRLISYTAALKVGPAEDPGNFMGAVADEHARRSIDNYIEIGRREGEILYQSSIPEGEGFYVPITMIGGIRPAHRLAREEVFGPVLAVMRAKDFGDALAQANSTRFALTGGVFSRSPEHLARAGHEFRVGNLYLNRGITGAMVGRQPFGGSRMSGGGTKAGGPDYLLHFMDPRVVTENTMRRGFIPSEQP